MDNLYINHALKEYQKKKPKRFHMPGHKGNSEFVKIFKQAKEDITEIADFDNLQNPNGIIKKVESDIAKILGAEKCWLLTDGSTCGVHAMLQAVRHKGNKIIINRNAHKSVYDICRILNVEPIILQQNIKHGMMLPPSIEEIKKAIIDNPDAIGLFLTYPDYYGNYFDIETVKNLCVKSKKLLLIDNAHGAHVRFVEPEKYAGNFADIWVDGVHKSLPCLTQGAVLCVNNLGLINSANESVNIFRTSSPNYIIMSSIEYGEKYMATEGAEKIKKLIEEILLLKNRLTGYGYGVLYGNDIFKLVVDFKRTGISPYVAEQLLNKNNVYTELNDGRYIVFMISVFTEKRDLVVLEKLLKKIIKKKKASKTFVERTDAVIGNKKKNYLESANSKRIELVPLENSAGRISACNFGLFPPCFPLVLSGEEITENIVNIMLNAKETFGVIDGKVKVLKG